MNTQINIGQIPQYVKDLAGRLIDNQFSAYIVGGAIRDLLIDRPPKDFDIATNATPEQMRGLFPRSIFTGARFGNIQVITQDEKGERYDVDITTFREDQEYYGGRWPKQVNFKSNVESDLSRRDFTINALAIDANHILNLTYTPVNYIIDPFKGINDISNKVIRAVRNPDQRFNEDGLRAYKACRLASELDFEIEPNTLEAIKRRRNIAAKISLERIATELRKILTYSPKPSKGIRYLDQCGLLKIIIPELELTKSIVQPRWHKFDLFEHSLLTMDNSEDDIKLAGLLHDIGKIKTLITENSKVNFFGHANEGAKLAFKILKRLKIENRLIDETCLLIKHHMFSLDNNNPTTSAQNLLKKLRNSAMDSELINKLIRLRISDGSSTGFDFDYSEITYIQQNIEKAVLSMPKITLEQLEINGNDLINIGFIPGPIIGKTLNNLLKTVNNKPELNTHQSLVKHAKTLVKKK